MKVPKCVCGKHPHETWCGDHPDAKKKRRDEQKRRLKPPKGRKRRGGRMSPKQLRHAQQQAHAEKLRLLREPKYGVKPPDPEPPKPTAPGSGVDEWRDEE